MNQEGTFRGANGAELFYRVYQTDYKPKAAILAVHGLGDHSGGLQNLLLPLTENGYISYAIDLRGHGNSSGVRGYIQDWEDYRGDLNEFRQLVEASTPGLPLYIMGHSLGGVVSLDYVLHHNKGIAGLVAIAPAVSYELTLFEKLFISLLGVLKPDFTLKQSANLQLLTREEEALTRMAADTLRHQMVTPGLGKGLIQTVPRLISEANNIRLPFLLMYGLDDKITPPEKLRHFFESVGSERKEKREYPGTLHRPFEDFGKEQFISDLINWFDHQK